jgi:hypothetical protein
MPWLHGIPWLRGFSPQIPSAGGFHGMLIDVSHGLMFAHDESNQYYATYNSSCSVLGHAGRGLYSTPTACANGNHDPTNK